MSDSHQEESAVWRAATELFEGDRAVSERWLHREAKGLGGKRPLDVIQEDPQQLLDLILLPGRKTPVGMLHR